MATFQPNSKTVYANPATYTPDFSFLDGMLKRKEAQYNQGFAQVSQKYSNLAQDVSRQDNRESRDNFLMQAKENLKNLSAMDLSLQENVEEAGKVFAPLYENENLLGDISLTKHYKSQRNIAESLKTKDGGKGFNQANIDYVLMQQEDFINDKDPSKWRQYMSQRRSYEPYSDYSKKYQDAYKDFKPSVTSTPTLRGKQGEWLVQTKDASVHSEEFRQHLESYLSPQDKRQLEIEGVVKYGRTAEQLKDVYTKKIDDRIKNIDTDIKTLTDRKVVYKNKADLEIIDKQIGIYNNTKEQLVKKLNEANTKSIAEYQPIKDQLASSLYYEERLTEFGNAAERKDITEEIKVNDVWKANFDATHAIALKNLESSNRRAEMKLQAALDFQTGKYRGRGAGTGEEDEEYDEAGNKKSPFLGTTNTLKTDQKVNPIAQIDNQLKDADQKLASVWFNFAQDIGVKTIEEAKKYANALAEDSKTQKWNFAKNTMTDLKTGTVYTGVEYNRKKLERDKYLSMQQQLTAPSTIHNALTLQKRGIEQTVRAKDPSLYKNVITELKKSPINNEVIDGKLYTIIDIYNGIINGSIKTAFDSGGMGIAYNSPFGGKRSNRNYKFEINGKFYDFGKNPRSQSLIDYVYKTKESALGQSYDKLREDALKEMNISTISNETAAHINPNSNLGKTNIAALNAQFGTGTFDPATSQVRNKPEIIIARLKDPATKEAFLKKIADQPNIKYDPLNDVFRITNTAMSSMFASYSEEDRANYQLATVDFKGKKNQFGNYEMFSQVPFIVPGVQDHLMWKRTVKEVKNIDGSIGYDYNFDIFVDGIKEPINSITNTPINSGEQLVAYIKSLKANPAGVQNFVKSLKEE